MKRPWRRPAALWLVGWTSLALVVDLFWPHAAVQQNLLSMLVSPSLAHPFGTDSLGRDLFLRLLAGTKVSLTVGILASAFSLLVGVCYGLISGWRGGWTDRFLMSFTEIFIAVPSFIFVAVFTLAFQSSVPLPEGVAKSALALTLGIGLSHWMVMARVTRAMVLQAKVLPYIDAARALGAQEHRILWRHVLPNIRHPILVLFGLQIPASILYESFMSFIGIGVQAPHTSWGTLVQDGWRSLSSHPHLILFPALILFLTVWSLQSLIDHNEGGDQPPNPSSKTSAAEMAK